MRTARLLPVLLCLLPFVLAVPAAAQGPEVASRTLPGGDLYTAGGAVRVGDSVAGDVVAAGGSVEVDADVGDNAIAAGGSVRIGRLVAGDVLAAGGSVDVAGPVGDDVRAAGGEVRVSGPVGGNALLAGGWVELNGDVTGSALLGGGGLRVAGTVGGDLEAQGNDVTLDGTVRGNANLAGETIVLGPGARVMGDLTYRSPRPATIHPDARVTGRIEHVPAEYGGPTPGGVAAAIVSLVALMLGLGLAAALYRFGFPRFVPAAVAQFRGAPWAALGLGFALLLAVPVAGTLLSATVVGLPVGVAVLVAYPLLLLGGLLTLIAWLADAAAGLFGLGRRPPPGWHVVLLLLAAVVVAVVNAIPVLGSLVVLFGLLMGMGALTLQAVRVYRGTPPGPFGR